jgi:cobalt/nickel transport protein
MSGRRLNLALLLLAAALAAAPLLLAPDGGAGRFKGSDDRALEAIAAVAPDYRPWVRPLWQPPSGEVQSLLFSLQAALGAGLIGYYLGLRRGRSQRREGPGRPPRREDAGHPRRREDAGRPRRREDDCAGD